MNTCTIYGFVLLPAAWVIILVLLRIWGYHDQPADDQTVSQDRLDRAA